MSSHIESKGWTILGLFPKQYRMGLSSFNRVGRYKVITSEDAAESGVDDESSRPDKIGPAFRWPIIAFVVLLALVSAIVARNRLLQPAYDTQDAFQGEIANIDDTTNASGCERRQEWRSLSQAQQSAYIDAVLCLRDQPSVLSSEQTAYDDFPWIHSHVGYFTHNSAPFLPWHRYFLHIYEETLRSKCGYNGSLVYWDWTLDSEALEHSPVFDAETAFGGDGQIDAPISIGRSGRCIIDGPFAGVNVSFYDVKYKPHCLSRGFRDQEGNLGHIDGHDISAASIQEVLELDKYEDFVALMESRVHDAIPFGIGGDFETFTAPYDPIFFLHHTQLDRLWWLWQSRDDSARMNDYGGHKQRHSIEVASLEDSIDMRNLAPSVKVSEVMDTEGDLLCYRY